jgi:hypothetical protein
MNVINRINPDAVHKYACGAAYFMTMDRQDINVLSQLEPLEIVPDYDIGDQIIKFSMIFSKLILANNHVLNPISGKIT